jgi:hypothetical protein
MPGLRHFALGLHLPLLLRWLMLVQLQVTPQLRCPQQAVPPALSGRQQLQLTLLRQPKSQ